MLVALTLLGVLLFPSLGLLFVLWMGHLEDTLPRDVRATARKPDPAPILAMPVRRPAGPRAPSPTVPLQRTPPVVETTTTSTADGAGLSA